MTTLYKGRNVSDFITVIFYKYNCVCCLLAIISTILLCSLFILGLRRLYRGVVCELWILRVSQEYIHVISWYTIHEYFLEALGTTTNVFSQNGQCVGLYLNLEPPKKKRDSFNHSVISFPQETANISQMKHQLDATLCRFYFCRVTLHVSGASAHHQEYL